MKKIIRISLVLIALMVSNCGNIARKDGDLYGLQQTDTGTVEIAFKEYEHDFGKV